MNQNIRKDAKKATSPQENVSNKRGRHYSPFFQIFLLPYNFSHNKIKHLESYIGTND